MGPRFCEDHGKEVSLPLNAGRGEFIVRVVAALSHIGKRQHRRPIVQIGPSFLSVDRLALLLGRFLCCSRSRRRKCIAFVKYVLYSGCLHFFRRSASGCEVNADQLEADVRTKEQTRRRQVHSPQQEKPSPSRKTAPHAPSRPTATRSMNSKGGWLPTAQSLTPRCRSSMAEQSAT